MLTDPLLVSHLTGKLLREWEPMPGVPVRKVRGLLFTPEVFDRIYAYPWPREPEDTSDRDPRERRRSLHAITGKFVGGQLMAPDEEIKTLDPSEDALFERLLELRSGPPRPQSRLFAYVFCPGVWIGVGFHLRSNLGDFDDPRWSKAAADARTEWDRLFPGRPPHPVGHPCNSFAKLKAICNAN